MYGVFLFAHIKILSATVSRKHITVMRGAQKLLNHFFLMGKMLVNFL